MNILGDSKRGSKAQVLNSAFYIGSVLHKRFQPKLHQFKYPLYMMAINLDEVDDIDRQYWWFSQSHWSPLQLNYRDYLGSYSRQMEKAKQKNNDVKTEGEMAACSKKYSGSDLSPSKRLKATALALAAELGANCTGLNRIVMLAQMRCFGLYFSPVNFFFLQQDDDCRYVLAEVSNTPWNEKHCYLIDLSETTTTPKDFHVSPFMNMDMEYRWHIQPPKQSTRIDIESWRDQRLFKAVFSATRHDISPANLRKVLLNWPVVTLAILLRIYWQALRLYLKGIAYVPYIKSAKPTTALNLSNTLKQGDKHENV